MTAPLQWTRFEDVQARAKRELVHAWPAFVDGLRNVTARSRKQACPLLKLARFGEQRSEKGSLRHDANLVEITGLEADYDGEQVAPDAALELLERAGIKGAIYTSPSHRPEAPRWRVVAPLSLPQPPERRTPLLNRLNGALGGILAAESWTLSQTYYFGRVNGAPYRVLVTFDDPDEGHEIDTLDELDAIAVGPTETKSTVGDDAPAAPVIVTDQTIRELRSALAAIPSDDRGLWVRMGHALKELGDRGRGLWLEWSQTSDKYDPADAAHKWASFKAERTGYAAVFAEAQRRGWVNPRTAGEAAGESPLIAAKHLTTDAANAQRLLQTAGADVFVVGGRWYVWTGTHWGADDGAAVRAALRLSALILEEAKEWETREAPSEDERKRNRDIAESLRKWSKQSEMKPRLDAALGLLKQLLGVDASTVDADPWLLNVANGTIDLRTGELRPHAREDRITKLIHLEYQQEAPAPRWARFLAEITNEEGCQHAPITAFLARWYGYCATGSTREEALAVLWGDGGNGKSKLVGAIESVLGPYAGTAAHHLLIASREPRHSTELADLFGKRLVTASETPDGADLAEATVKAITGGNRISARHMRQDAFEFTPTHKVQLETNYRPNIKGSDRGIWRRIVLVPFVVTFGTADEVAAGKALRVGDDRLAQALLDERPGILAWIVRGAREWYARGLNPPDIVLDATAAYRADQDRIGEFLQEECELDRGTWAPLLGASGVYTRYVTWCKESGYHALGRGRFQQAINNRVPGARWERRSVKGDFGKYTTLAGVWGVRLA